MADVLDVRMARLEGAYDQISKRLDDLHGDLNSRRARSALSSSWCVSKLHTGLRSQFWQFAALVVPLWLATAALLFRH